MKRYCYYQAPRVERSTREQRQRIFFLVGVLLSSHDNNVKQTVPRVFVNLFV